MGGERWAPIAVDTVRRYHCSRNASRQDRWAFVQRCGSLEKALAWADAVAPIYE